MDDSLDPLPPTSRRLLFSLVRREVTQPEPRGEMKSDQSVGREYRGVRERVNQRHELWDDSQH